MRGTRIEAEDCETMYVLNDILDVPLCDSDELINARESSSDDLLWRLSNHGNSEVRKAVAGNIHASPAILYALSKDFDIDVRFAVALNSSTPPDILLRLFSEDNHQMKIHVLGNPNTPLNILEDYAVKGSLMFCLCISRNPNSSLKALESIVSRMENDSVLKNDDDLVIKIARHRNASAGILDQIARLNGNSYWIDKAVIEHPNVSQETLIRLTFSEDARIAELAARKLMGE